MSNTNITPYLFFAGRCEEAIDFYQKALDAQVDMIMRFNESPEPTPPGMLQEGFDKKVMHASFRVGEARVMASDGCDDKSKFEGFRLALTVQTEVEAHKAFNALAEGGQHRNATMQDILVTLLWDGDRQIQHRLDGHGARRDASVGCLTPQNHLPPAQTIPLIKPARNTLSEKVSFEWP